MFKLHNLRTTAIIQLTVVLIFFTTALVFSGVLNYSFLNWDDGVQIYENTSIRDVGFKNIYRMFIALDPELHIWQPIPRLTYSLDYQLFGLAPWGYHLTSLLIHGANTCLVFGIFFCLVSSSNAITVSKPVLCLAGSLTALTFGIHPLRVEPVSWISSRDELLCSFFFLSSILTYIVYLRDNEITKRYSLLAIAWLLFLFALMSKAMAISLPIVLLLLDACPFIRIRGFKSLISCVVEKIPFLILSVLSGVMTLVTRSSSNPPQTILELNIFSSLWDGFKTLLFYQSTSEKESIGLAERAILSIQNIWFYIQKTLWPEDLLPYYPAPENLTLSSGPFWFSLFITLTITAVCVKQIKRGNLLWITIWSYYLITILPVLGFVYSGYRGPNSDRYTYISTLSFYFLAGLAFLRFWKHKVISEGSNLYKTFILGSGIILISTLATLTYQQSKIWKDGESFWSYLLANHPKKAFALSSMGDHYRNSGQMQKAISSYLEALNIDPSLHETRNNLGLIYSKDSPESAEQEFKMVLEQVPEYYPAHNNLGVLYMGQKKTDLAIQSFTKALNIKPGYARSHNNLGLIFMEKKLLEKAEAEFISALENKPGFVEAHNNLGMIYMALGKLKKAENNFEKALTLNPDFEPAFKNLLILQRKRSA
ncbi:MAG: tetratricopeptide repeat protein [Nitrospinae bacterium]|nr:tetratricopeptide repeat protein [Nitrospinota bacterium]